MKSALDYRNTLHSHFEERRRRNPSYSLRAFARDLGISPERLSSVLNGKYGLSVESAKRVAKKLDLAEAQTELFCLLVEGEHARSQAARKMAKEKIESLTKEPTAHFLTLDAFQVIADWYHFAILELTLVSDFQSNLNWISKKLGISKVEAKLAIERLLRLELLEVDGSGGWKASTETTFAPKGVPAQSKKRFLEQLMIKAQKALFESAFEKRDYAASLYAIDSSKLPKIKDEVASFRKKIASILNQPGPKDSVYALNVQFFSVLEGEHK